MKHMLAIKDHKTGGFNDPVFATHAPKVVRELALHIKQSPQSPYATFPADYSLWLLGTFQEETGEILPQASPEHIMNFTDIIELYSKEVKNG